MEMALLNAIAERSPSLMITSADDCNDSPLIKYITHGDFDVVRFGKIQHSALKYNFHKIFALTDVREYQSCRN